MVVVAVAALLARSVYNLKAQDAGFDPEGVVTFYVDTFGKQFSRAELSSLYDAVVDRMAAAARRRLGVGIDVGTH